MKKLKEIIEDAESLVKTAGDENTIGMLKMVARSAALEERAKLIAHAEEKVALFVDGPLRDSVYALLDELKELTYEL